MKPSAAPRVTQVLLVDDHPAICDALRHVIEAQPDMQVCGQASSAREVSGMVQAFAPDVVVLDLLLEDAHGLDLAEVLFVEAPDTRVLIYSMYDERVYAERALQAGARGYVMKSAPPRDVVEAIRRTDRGDVYLSATMSRHLLTSMARDASKAGLSIEKLTRQEIKVLHFLGQGQTPADISRKLHINRKTVEAYRRRIRQKLGLRTLTELMQYAFHFSMG